MIWLLVLEHCTGGDLFDYVKVSWLLLVSGSILLHMWRMSLNRRCENWIELRCVKVFLAYRVSIPLPPSLIYLGEHTHLQSFASWCFKENYVSQNKCMEILMCVFSGLAHLHSLNIVHRDVKAAPWPIHRNYPFVGCRGRCFTTYLPRKWRNVPWKRTILKGSFIFQPAIFRQYVSFQAGKQKPWCAYYNFC